MDLPPEILGLALSLLPKVDLKKARLVSKAWERAAVPSLFDEVFMSPNPADLNTAEIMIDQFACHIRTLTFSAVYYRAMSWTAYQREAPFDFPQSVSPRVRNLHMRYGHQNYCRVRNEQMEVLERGTCLAHLCRALRTLPNLQRLVLKDLGSEPPGSFDNPYCEGLEKRLEPCSINECRVSPMHHLDFLLRPDSGFSHAVTSPWNLTMLALWTVGFPVKEIAVKSWVNLPMKSFVNAAKRPYELALLFKSLTKLRLHLRMDPEDPVGIYCSREGLVARALSGAKSLQYLHIRTQIDPLLGNPELKTPFQASLGSCQFPKLRSLILHSYESTMEELLTFLGASEQLQRISLIHYELLSGTWEQAADWMRRISTLREADIDHLSGGWGPDSPVALFDNGEYTDNFGHVEDFFLRQGPNPFSDKMLAAREKRLN